MGTDVGHAKGSLEQVRKQLEAAGGSALLTLNAFEELMRGAAPLMQRLTEKYPGHVLAGAWMSVYATVYGDAKLNPEAIDHAIRLIDKCRGGLVVTLVKAKARQQAEQQLEELDTSKENAQ